jgi:hypothetical protein
MSQFISVSHFLNIQGVSKVRVLILTSGRTRQFMRLFSITFCKIRKIFQDFLPLNFDQTSRFVRLTSLFFCNHEDFNFDYLIF